MDQRGRAVTRDNADLGPCCVCELVGPSVRNVMMLPKRAVIPGRGWGCFVCGLPLDGAVAVVCDACMIDVTKHGSDVAIQFACRGYPKTDGRVLYADLVKPFRHDRRRHPDMADDDPG